MKRIYVFYVKACCVAALLLIAHSCSEPEQGIPVNDGPAPLKVTDVKVNPMPGGAVLTYQLPPDGNILYVMAEYTLADGVPRNKKASYFNQSITLEGFPDTVAYRIDLYSVARNGVKSDPISKTIVPLEPPYRIAYRSLQMEPTFGGVKVSFENESGASMKFVVLAADSTGKLYEADIYNTKLVKGSFPVINDKKFGPRQRLFGVYTIDRWNNRSDTLFAELTPWYRTILDKTRFVNAKLPSDVWENHLTASYVIETVWDGKWGEGGLGFHTKPNTGIPQWFTIDLKVKAQLSQMKFHHRHRTGTDGQYNAGDVQIFEIYGSNTPVDEWTSDWVLLGHFESIKPSGQASGFTEDDLQYASMDGEDFNFTNNYDAFRYLRFKTLKTWGGVTYIYIAELTFWGNVIETYY